MTRCLLRALWICLLLCSGSLAAFAQAFPSRTITLCVPFPPGGSTDAIARILAERLQSQLGVAVVIENVAGAGGSIGAGRVARAPADGYALVVGQWDTLVGSIIYKLNYNLETDFTPIGLISINPQLLIARNALGPSDLRALLAYIKANPGKVLYVNQNSAGKLSGIQLQNAAGGAMQFVPYRGAGPAMNDMLAGQVDLMTIQASGALPQIQAGTLTAVANLSAQRSPAIPDIPTPADFGIDGLTMSGWFGLFGPKNLQPEIVTALNAALKASLANRQLQTRFTELGIDVAPENLQAPEGLDRFHKSEIKVWWPIIKAAGLLPDP